MGVLAAALSLLLLGWTSFVRRYEINSCGGVSGVGTTSGSIKESAVSGGVSEIEVGLKLRLFVS